MENPSALVTVAMLTTYLSKEHKDYLDIITPFVLKTFPKNIGEKIDLEHITSILRSDFGFEDFPMNVLKKILERCSKRQGYLKKENKEYYLKRTYDYKTFDKNQNEIRKSIDEVINSLYSYFNKNIKRLSKENVTNIFIDFMEYYGYSVMNNFDRLKGLTKNEKNNYHVARFIINEYENDTNVFNSLLEIIKGFYVYKAIYFFSSGKKKTFSSRLLRTSVYLDTRIVINALGYHLNEDKKATRELLRLINDSGGVVKVFEHTVGEICSILTKYARDPMSRATMNLDYFDRNAYESTDVIRVRDKIRLKLQEIKIEVVDTPDQSVSSEDNLKDMGFIDIVELKTYIEKCYLEVGKRPKSENIERDVESISAISRIRGKLTNPSLESCKAIFVTPNSIITKATNELYSDRFSKGEISFIINEMDLTALLWLRTFDKKSDLPNLKLLEIAYSALRPTDEIISVFNDKVVILEQEGRISGQEALLMRTQHVVKYDIVSLSENDPSKVNDVMVLTVRDNYIKELTKTKDASIEELIKELNEEKRRKSRAIDKADTYCFEKSEKYANKFKRIAKLSLILFALIGSCLIIYDNFYNKQNGSITYLGATITLLTIIPFFDWITGKIGVLEKFIMKSKQKRFDELYKVEIEKIEKIFE